LAAALVAAVAVAFAFAVSARQSAEDPNQRVIAAIQRLLLQRPNDPTLYFYLGAYQAAAGARDDSLASLRKTMEIGEGFLPSRFLGYERIWDDQDFQRLRAAMEAKLPRIADAKVAFEIPDKKFIPEGIAYDPESKTFFVGSISHQSIVRASLDGKISPFSKQGDGLRHILGIAVDAKRRALYAVSSSALTEAGRKTPVNEVVKYDLKTGKKVAAFAAREAQQLNDVTVAPNGDVYASDSASGAVFRLDVKAGVLNAFLPPGRAPGANGVAVKEDGKILYVAHSTGVFRVDTASGETARLAPPERETIAAIDGLYFWQGDLIGVQNVTNPGRVIRIRLVSDGAEVKAVETLQSHHQPAFDEPTTGAIVGDAFYALGTTQVARFNANGEIEAPETLKTPKVVRVPLNQPGGVPSATKDEEEQLKAAMGRYERFTLAMNAEGIAAMFAPDGELINDGKTIARTPDSIRAFLKSFDGKVRVEENLNSIESITVTGATAVLTGTYRQKALLLPDKREIRVQGKFEVEWTRQPDGQWLIRRMGTQSTPPERPRAQ
jgi:ketosteroid isomerase-like protein